MCITKFIPPTYLSQSFDFNFFFYFSFLLPVQSSLNDPAVRSAKKAKTKLKLKQENLTVPTIPTSIPSSPSDNDSCQSDSEIELERTPSSFFVQSLSSVKKPDPHRTRQNGKPGKQKENNLNNKSRSNKKPQKVIRLADIDHIFVGLNWFKF